MFTLRAKWILPVEQPAIENGSISIDRGRIVSIDQPNRTPFDVDVGDVVVFPQWVNAHTHLEFSALREPLLPNSTFTQWIAAIIATRRRLDPAAAAERLTTAVQSGLSELQSAATAAIGEIRTTPWLDGDYRDARPICVVFYEALGLDPLKAPSIIEDLNRSICTGANSENFWLGLSPHAPYSTSIELVRSMAELARRHGLPIAMHLAESREELELLRTGGGPFRTLLDELGVWHAGGIKAGCSIVDYLKVLSMAQRSLVVHGNYLSDMDMDFIASQKGQMAVAYCPRTHNFFRHERYPLMELLRRGIEVSIATDSRATNPNLNLAEDLAFASELYPDVSANEWLRMGTLYPARAIGLEDQVGSLAVGKRAAFAAVSIASSSRDNPEEAWLQAIRERVPVQSIMVEQPGRSR